jgi:hypothetical protein
LGDKHKTAVLIVLLTTTAAISAGAPIDENKIVSEPAGGKAFSFTEVTSAMGISVNPLAGGHGVAFQDVNGDGYLDIFVTNTPRPTVPANNFLFINNQGTSFTEEAAARGVNGLASGAHGIFFADFDNDGDFDLLVAFAGSGQEGPGQSRLYINDGKGYFADGSKPARLLGRLGCTRGVAAADFNRDGKVDFILTDMYDEITEAPNAPIPVKNHFRNKKKGRFRPYKSGVVFTGFTQSIIVGDLNGDGYPDIVESKWPGWSFDSLTNSLWINDGSGKFTDSSKFIGDDFEHDGTTNYNGTALGDTDNDGDLDMILIGDKVRFYRNDGNLKFTDITGQTGLTAGAFCAALGDLDNDGDLDIVIPHSYKPYSVFENVGGNTFNLRSGTGVLPPYYNDARGAALGDYDNDGDLDIAIVHKYNRVQLFRNNINSRTWLKLLLVSPSGELGAVGAKVRVYETGHLGEAGRLLIFREAGGNAGYLDQNSAVVHLGFTSPKQRVDIEVEYVDGSKYTLSNVRQRQLIKVDPRKLEKVKNKEK